MVQQVTPFVLMCLHFAFLPCYVLLNALGDLQFVFYLVVCWHFFLELAGINTPFCLEYDVVYYIVYIICVDNP